MSLTNPTEILKDLAHIEAAIQVQEEHNEELKRQLKAGKENLSTLYCDLRKASRPDNQGRLDFSGGEDEDGE